MPDFRSSEPKCSNFLGSEPNPDICYFLSGQCPNMSFRAIGTMSKQKFFEISELCPDKNSPNIGTICNYEFSNYRDKSTYKFTNYRDNVQICVFKLSGQCPNISFELSEPWFRSIFLHFLIWSHIYIDEKSGHSAHMPFGIFCQTHIQVACNLSISVQT